MLHSVNLNFGSNLPIHIGIVKFPYFRGVFYVTGPLTDAMYSHHSECTNLTGVVLLACQPFFLGADYYYSNKNTVRHIDFSHHNEFFRNIKKWYKLNVDTPRSFFWLQLCNADLIYHHGHGNCTDSYSYLRRHELIFPLFWSFTQHYNVFKPLRLQSSRTLYKLHRNQRTYNGYH